MKKVIVLGSNGQLGKTIKDFADSNSIEFSFYSRFELDIIDKNSLNKTFERSKFDYCINCAAYTNVEGAELNTNEAFLINGDGAKYIAIVCAENKTKLIHISTDYVFDGSKEIPHTITEKTNPINQYGKSKLKGELHIQEQLGEYYIIRTSWLYGLHGKNFFKTIISKIKNDETLEITTEERGTPTSCIDLVEFIFYIIKIDSLPYGIYNFSGNGSTTWFGFAKEIVKIFDSDKINYVKPSDKFITLVKRPKYSVFNLSKTERLYKVLQPWQESLEKMVKILKRVKT